MLKNYTSEVAPSITISRIQKTLLKAGVRSLEMEYGSDHKVAAMIFKIEFEAGKFLHAKLWLDYVGKDKLSQDGQYSSSKRKNKKSFLDQAERTAWKLMQDWIEVQLSLIQLNQVEVVQVFLPFVWDGKRTFYETLKGSGFRALMPPTETVEVVP